MNYVALYELRRQNFAQLNVPHRLYVLGQKYSLDGTSSLAVRWCSYDASSTLIDTINNNADIIPHSLNLRDAKRVARFLPHDQAADPVPRKLPIRNNVVSTLLFYNCRQEHCMCEWVVGARTCPIPDVNVTTGCGALRSYVPDYSYSAIALYCKAGSNQVRNG